MHSLIVFLYIKELMFMIRFYYNIYGFQIQSGIMNLYELEFLI